jgi:GntR family transcriptional repressor for pyruvate dehydrogenase complex
LSLEPITRRHSTYQEIIDRIRSYIITSNLKPGDRLPSEPEMARTLQVNRSTLREALRALQLLGVIDVRHGHGTFVRAFSLDAVWSNLNYNMLLDATELGEVLVVRTRLEAAFITEVAERVTDEQIAELHGIIACMRTKASMGEQIIEEDEAFHIALFAQVDNAFLKRLLAIFWQTVKQMKQNVELVNSTDLQSAIYKHVLLVESLEKRDIAALQHHTLHHGDGFLERVNWTVEHYRQIADK